MQIIIVYVNEDILMCAESPANAPVRLCIDAHRQGVHPADKRLLEAHRGQYRRWHRQGKVVDNVGQRH